MLKPGLPNCVAGKIAPALFLMLNRTLMIINYKEGQWDIYYLTIAVKVILLYEVRITSSFGVDIQCDLATESHISKLFELCLMVTPYVLQGSQ